MPMVKFLVYTTIGSAIWNTVLVLLGSAMGENWTKIVDVMDQYSHIIVIVLAILLIAGIAYFYLHKRKKKANKK